EQPVEEFSDLRYGLPEPTQAPPSPVWPPFRITLDLERATPHRSYRVNRYLVLFVSRRSCRFPSLKSEGSEDCLTDASYVKRAPPCNNVLVRSEKITCAGPEV